MEINTEQLRLEKDALDQSLALNKIVVSLSQEEKELMRLHYLENKDFCYIGDQLGYSEITMKRWHKKILRKLNKVL